MKTMREEAKQRFAENTENHTVEIRHDDGLYRHLVCSNNGSSLYRFDVVTYPEHLVVSGDMCEWMFSSIADMFQFFRSQDGGINPGYWAEKCRAGKVTEFSMDKFQREVMDYVVACHDGDKGTILEELTEAIESEVFEPVKNGDDPYSCLSEFEFSYQIHLPDSFCSPPVFRFRVVDMSEFSFSDYTLHFLWALHGIVWAINEYDRLKA